jgi:hypothetical protein
MMHLNDSWLELTNFAISLFHVISSTDTADMLLTNLKFMFWRCTTCAQIFIVDGKHKLVSLLL